MEIVIRAVANDSNFDEEAYFSANPDVLAAVKAGLFATARSHYVAHGKNEGRWLHLQNAHGLHQLKASKRQKILPLLRDDMPMLERGESLDFLTDELRDAFNIVATDNVSSNNYAPENLALIEKHRDGLILDCGAGQRSTYYDNVVNFEIVDYDTTDVRGVGERLPFKDNSFDAVFSMAVLEHVKDPFQCANEISRVLKPGGDLLCMVPFLQPMHGYPNHYYNMTQQGIRNLFEANIDIHHHEVPPYALPIWTLNWMLSSWSKGLTGKALEEFLNLKVADLIGDSVGYLGRSFVQQLSADKNFELACGTTIMGTKKA